MEFYLKDCITGEYKGFKSMKDLARFWLRKFDKCFNQLNLTGKDILTETVFKGMSLSRNGLPIPEIEKRRTLRRYQVLDKDGRSVDIREWPDYVWEPEHSKPLRFIYTGHKNNRRRVTGPSLQYRLLKAPEPDEEESILGKTSIRSKAVMDARDWWHYYDRASCRGYYKPRSWKDQTRSRHQWTKKPATRRGFPAAQESGEDLARRLSYELGIAA